MSDLEIEIAPAFRFDSTIKFKRDFSIERNVILLALPIQINESINIVKLVLAAKLDDKYKIFNV